MPIWKITQKGPVRVSETKLKQEKLLEEHLEDWVVNDSSILGEPLLIIGRQVMIPDVKDRLDILALDPQGNAVIVELKRGKLKDPVDMQALRYASYISKWHFEDFENQARAYWGRDGDVEFNFNDTYEQFCTKAGIDEVPDINSDQRVIIVGSEVKDKLGSVALWLHDHSIDVKVIEVEVFREGETLLLEPHVIIPLPVSRFHDTGRAPRGDISKPWIGDGKTWHLDKRCSSTTKNMLLTLDDLIRDNLDVEETRWDQKFYVAYRINNYNWLSVGTHRKILILDFLVKPSAFKLTDLAKRLEVEQFDKEESIAEKFGLPSSVFIEKINENVDRVRLRIKEGFNLNSEAFLTFLKDAFKASPFSKE